MKTIVDVMEPYSVLGSWAVWESNREDGKFKKEKDIKEDIDFNVYADKLQKNNKIILGMNPGGNFSLDAAKNVTRTDENGIRHWGNFHCIGRSRDYLLASAIMGTELEGCYMTDLFPIVGSSSNEVKEFIKNPENKEQVTKLIKAFDNEMNKVLPNNEVIELYCLGGHTKSWAIKYLVNCEKSLDISLSKQYVVHYLPHYSGANRYVSSSEESDKYYPKVLREKLEENKKRNSLNLK